MGNCCSNDNSEADAWADLVLKKKTSPMKIDEKYTYDNHESQISNQTTANSNIPVNFNYGKDIEKCSAMNELKPEVVSIMQLFGELKRKEEYDRLFQNLDEVHGPLLHISSGNTYLGGFMKKTPHGWGKLISNTFTVIEGYFQRGSPSFYYRQVYEDLTCYEGEVFGGKKNGKGKFLNIKGEILEGMWVEDKLHGPWSIRTREGELIFKGNMIKNRKEGHWYFKDVRKGFEYEGHFRDGLFYGIGKLTYESGAYYIGNFHIGFKEGRGKMFYADQSSYDGQWYRDQEHGKGVLTDPFGNSTDIELANGELINQDLSKKIQ